MNKDLSEMEDFEMEIEILFQELVVESGKCFVIKRRCLRLKWGFLKIMSCA
jgi:hypothetical protein